MKRLNKILNRFQHTIDDLLAHAEVVGKEIGVHDEQIAALTDNRNALSEERVKALAVANKIGGMISA